MAPSLTAARVALLGAFILASCAGSSDLYFCSASSNSDSLDVGDSLAVLTNQQGVGLQYVPSLSCTVTVTVPTGYRVLVHFTAFNTESGYDYFRVADGPSVSSAVLGTSNTLGFSGSLLPADMTTTSNSVSLSFRSDGSVQYSGVRVELSAVNPATPSSTATRTASATATGTPSRSPSSSSTVFSTTSMCPGTTNTLSLSVGGSIRITTNTYGNSYYSFSQDCRLAISAPTGYRIMLRFVGFYTEGCCDFFQVADGPTISSALLVSSAGFNAPATELTSTSNAMTLRFTSDSSVQYSGVQVVLSLVAPPTPSTSPTVSPTVSVTSTRTGSSTTTPSGTGTASQTPTSTETPLPVGIQHLSLYTGSARAQGTFSATATTIYGFIIIEGFDYFLSLEPTGPNAAAYLFNARTLGCGTSVPEAITEDSFWAVNATAQVATLTLAGRGTSSRWWTAGSPVYCQPSGIVGEAYQLTVEAVPWPSATSTPSPSPSTSPSATASATLSPSCTPLAGSISSLHMGVNGTVQQSLSTGSHSFFALDATSSGYLVRAMPATPGDTVDFACAVRPTGTGASALRFLYSKSAAPAADVPDVWRVTLDHSDDWLPPNQTVFCGVHGVGSGSVAVRADPWEAPSTGGGSRRALAPAGAILQSSFAVNETSPASFEGAIPIWGYQYFSFSLGPTATDRGYRITTWAPAGSSADTDIACGVAAPVGSAAAHGVWAFNASSSTPGQDSILVNVNTSWWQPGQPIYCAVFGFRAGAYSLQAASDASTPAPQPASDSKSTPVLAIALGVAGGALALSLLVAAVAFWRRPGTRRPARSGEDEAETAQPVTQSPAVQNPTVATPTAQVQIAQVVPLPPQAAPIAGICPQVQLVALAPAPAVAAPPVGPNPRVMAPPPPAVAPPPPWRPLSEVYRWAAPYAPSRSPAVAASAPPYNAEAAVCLDAPPAPPSAPPLPPAGAAVAEPPRRDATEEARLKRELESLREERECPVCLQGQKDTAFQCGHRVCFACSPRLTTCPICRAVINTRIHLF